MQNSHCLGIEVNSFFNCRRRNLIVVFFNWSQYLPRCRQIINLMSQMAAHPSNYVVWMNAREDIHSSSTHLDIHPTKDSKFRGNQNLKIKYLGRIKMNPSTYYNSTNNSNNSLYKLELMKRTWISKHFLGQALFLLPC